MGAGAARLGGALVSVPGRPSDLIRWGRRGRGRGGAGMLHDVLTTGTREVEHIRHSAIDLENGCGAVRRRDDRQEQPRDGYREGGGAKT